MSAVDPQTIRLEILKVLIPVSSRHGISSPEEITKTACVLEDYVVGSAQLPDGVKPDPSGRETLSLPRKDKSGKGLPEFLTPPTVDKSKPS